MVIKAVQNVVVKLMTLRRVFMKCNNVGKSPESSPVGSRSRGDASGCSVGSRLKRKVGYERSPHSVIKHAIVILFDQFKMYSGVFVRELILVKGASSRRCTVQNAIPALTR